MRVTNTVPLRCSLLLPVGTVICVQSPEGVHNGGWGWGAAMFDYDNDRDLDISMTNGFSVAGDSSYDQWTHWPKFLWKNNGGFGAVPEGDETQVVSKSVANTSGIDSTAQGRGMLYFDYDGTVRRFRQNSHAMVPLVPTPARCKQASRRLTNGIPLGCPLFLPVHTV
jgi:hypothetical protein